MTTAGRILVVEDHDTERRAISQILKSEGFTVFGAENADKAQGYIDENIDIVLSDLNMGDVSGMDLLQLWKKRQPETQFMLVSGQASVAVAVEAMKNGAYDYLTKPINPDELVLLIRRAIDTQKKDKEIDSLRRQLDQKFGLDQIVGNSKLMKDVFVKIQKAAPGDSTVLVLGETGTGKKGPFVAVNAAAVPATLVESELFGHVRGAFTGATDRRIGRFEQADGGTLFIDEIGDFELGLQSKLLRVLETLTVTPVGGHEDRKVNVRVLAATRQDIRKMVAAGTFREDLYYRLNVVTITLPPLRQRVDDIPLLIEHFLRQMNAKSSGTPKRVSPDVMRRLLSYAWPGNVRELFHAIERMIVLSEGDQLVEADLPDEILESASGSASPRELPNGLTMDELEKLAIIKALDACDGNRTHAAQRLNISVRTLQRKLQQYEMERPGSANAVAPVEAPAASGAAQP
jgi:DNA-binding NtrC family response regulator